VDIWKNITSVGSASWDKFESFEVFANTDGSFSIATEGRLQSDVRPFRSLLVADVDLFGRAAPDALHEFTYTDPVLGNVPIPPSLQQLPGSFNSDLDDWVWAVQRLNNGHWVAAYLDGSPTSTTFNYNIIIDEYDDNLNLVASNKLGSDLAPGRFDFTLQQNNYYTFSYVAGYTTFLSPQTIHYVTANSAGALPTSTSQIVLPNSGRAVVDVDTVWLNTIGDTRIYWSERNVGGAQLGQEIWFADTAADGTVLSAPSLFWSSPSTVAWDIKVAKGVSREYIAWGVEETGFTAADDLILAIRGKGGTNFISIPTLTNNTEVGPIFLLSQLKELANGNVALLWTKTAFKFADVMHVTIVDPNGNLVDDFTTTEFEDAKSLGLTELTDGRIVISGGTNTGDINVDLSDDLAFMIVDPRPDIIFGTSASETIVGKPNKAETIYGGDGNDAIYTISGGGTLYGEGGGDLLIGGEGTDFLYGGEGSDELHGLTSFDVLDGGDGDDILEGGEDNDVLFGGQGIDTLLGDNGDDEIYGGTEGDFITGGAGYDFLYGEDGDDFIHGGTDTDEIDGGAGDDGLYGEDGTDFIRGGTGNDALYGGSGIDLLYGDPGADRIDGGADQDTVTYVESTAGVTIDLANPAGNTGDAAGDTFFNVEIFRLTNYNDVFYAGNGTATVFVYGGAGNDQFLGQYSGNTIMNGGDGKDSFVLLGGNNSVRGDEPGGTQNLDALILGFSVNGVNINMTSAVTANTAFTFLFNGLTQTVYGDVEVILATPFVDVITGNRFDNVFEGGPGGDTLNGGTHLTAGDTVSYESSVVGVTVNIGTNTASGGDATGDVISNFENIYGSDFADVLTGSAGANKLDGNGGNDSLDGGNGNDIVNGGAGQDTIYIRNGLAGDADTVNGGSERDLLDMSGLTNGAVWVDLDYNLGPYQMFTANGLVAVFNMESMIGTAFGDTLRGDANSNYIGGGLGNDTILGYSPYDTVNPMSSLGDVLEGGAGNDTIFSGTGNDYIDGGADNDIIEVGGGTDTVVSGLGNDTIIFSPRNGTDTITDFKGGAGVVDVLKLYGFGTTFDTFAEVFAVSTQVGANTQIALTDTTIILQNFTRATLVADDFLFV
jgi:Ca2+-binding RTX toxin-like protein